MKIVRQHSAWILGAAVLLTAIGCQGSGETAHQGTGEPPEQSQATEPAAAADSMTGQPQAGDQQQTAQPTPEELAAREAEVAKREEAVAQREAAMSTRETSRATTPRTAAPSQKPTVAAVEPETPPAAPAATDEVATTGESWRERRAEREVTLQVPAGTTFDIEMADALSSETAQVGDRFSARTVGDLTEGAQVVIPAGARVEGAVASVQSLKKIGGQAQLVLRFDEIVLPDGQSYPLQASFAAAGRSETQRDAGTIAGTAAAGAILGRIIDKKNRDKHTVLGALVGAAVGTAIASKTPGEAVELPAGAVVTLSLDRALIVTRKVPAD
jgi:hypothetical protein